MVICLGRGADLHTAQLMPLPLTVSCFSKIQLGFTFLVLAHPGGPGQRAVKRVFVVVIIITLMCNINNTMSVTIKTVNVTESLALYVICRQSKISGAKIKAHKQQTGLKFRRVHSKNCANLQISQSCAETTQTKVTTAAHASLRCEATNITALILMH